MSKQFSSTIMRVAKVTAPKDKTWYQVFKLEDDGAWSRVSKVYEHSTSAFAALGRLYQKEVLQELAK